MASIGIQTCSRGWHVALAAVFALAPAQLASAAPVENAPSAPNATVDLDDGGGVLARRMRKQKRSKRPKKRRKTFVEPGPAAQEAVPAAQKVAPDPRKSIAVFPLRVSELQLNDVQRLNRTLRERVAADATLAMQGEELTTDLVESTQELGLDCDVNLVGCAVEVGGIADVNLVVLGFARGLKGDIGIDIRLVDVNTGTEIRRVSGLLEGERDAQQNTLVAIAARLLDSSAALPSTDVTTLPAGADVFVNGQLRGTTPLSGPIPGLLPGHHHIEVKKDGYLPQSTKISLLSGDVGAAVFTLLVDPETEVEREISTLELAAPWMIAGGAGLLGTAGLVGMAVGATPWVGYQMELSALSSLDEADPNYASRALAGWERSQGWAAAWNTWGQVALFAGAALHATSTVGAAAGAGWGGWLLLEPSDDEEAGPTNDGSAGSRAVGSPSADVGSGPGRE